MPLRLALSSTAASAEFWLYSAAAVSERHDQFANCHPADVTGHLETAAFGLQRAAQDNDISCSNHTFLGSRLKHHKNCFCLPTPGITHLVIGQAARIFWDCKT